MIEASADLYGPFCPAGNGQLTADVFSKSLCGCGAGAGQAGAVEDTPNQVPEQLLGLNSVAPIRLTQAILPFWLPHQGTLTVLNLV